MNTQDLIKEKLGFEVGKMNPPDQSWMVRIEKAKAVETCIKLKELGFKFLTMETAVCRDGGYDVVYLLDNWKSKEKIFVYAFVPKTDLNIPSLTPFWKAANWLEREIFDMFGINFVDHPNMTRILTPEGFEAFPLRKEFTDTD